MKRCIGLCVACINEYGPSDFYCAVYRRAREYGYGLLVYNSGAEKVSSKYHEGELAIYDHIDYDRLDGLIVMSETIKDERVLKRIISGARERGVFTVCLDRPVEGCYNVLFNYTAGFEAIVRHVIVKHGCKDICVMAGIKGNSFSEERVESCRRVMAEYGLTLPDENIMYGEFWSRPTAAEMDKFLTSGRELPDAIVCCNDSMAMTVCSKLGEYGYTVPDDVIVTGFDGIFDEKFHIPRLTTAKQDADLAGEKAVDAVIAHKNGRIQDNFALIDHKIQLTHSCGCKPIDYREASGGISVLFDIMTYDNGVDSDMHDLNDAVASSSDLSEVSENIFRYSDSYTWFYYCLCISEHFMSISSDYSRYLSSSADPGNTRLVLCEEFDGERIPPYCAKKPLHIEEALEKYGVLLYFPLHFQEMSVGYGVSVILPEQQLARDNGALKRLTKYTRNLNHSLEIANTQSVMRKVIAELQALYVRDHTGLFNRRGFYNEINRCIGLALDDTRVYYLVIVSVDMDGLKTINDTYGHSEGDVAIKAIADAMCSLWGDNEICARFGGDEFIIASLTTRAPKKHAQILMDELTGSLDRFNESSGKPYDVRVSLGMAYKKIVHNMQVDDLIKAADNLMYKEKATHEDSRYGMAVHSKV